ncbi:MAG: hypothetical protein CR968_02785 [Flavobacteriia bacterium]|nr:MAG: hypothetical protein CR968_02785 [Flavobacteriia bacterium]
MKKIYFIFLFALLTLNLQAQWILQDSGTGNRFYDIYPITADTAVVVGVLGTIVKTTDGGENWLTINSGTNRDLTQVEFVNDTTGYAVGFEGTLLKSTDAGSTWTALDSGTTEDLYSLSALNDQVFFISGNNGLLQKTIDGGNSWTVLTTPSGIFVTDIQFFNEQLGYILMFNYNRGTLYKTSDGGINWSQVDDLLWAFHFLNPNTGFVVSDELKKTTDGGENFVTIFSGEFDIPLCMFASSENVIWLAEKNAIIGNDAHIYRGEILNNQDFQWNYTEEPLLLQSICFYNENTGYGVDASGGIVKNTSGILLGTANTALPEHIKLYPNPVHRELRITFGEQAYSPTSISLVDQAGKEVLRHSYLQCSEINLNIEHLSKGIYCLNIMTPDNTYTQKVIIN